MKSVQFNLIAICVILMVSTSPVRGEDSVSKQEVFITWEGFEPDKCAVIWLIKKFINRDAQIRIFSQGEALSEGIPFDVPEAKFRRYANMSTFEFMIKEYKLIDPGLVYIGKIMHDIEINIWGKKFFPETRKIEKDIWAIIQQAITSEEVIEKSSHYFDSLYQRSTGN